MSIFGSLAKKISSRPSHNKNMNGMMIGAGGVAVGSAYGMAGNNYHQGFYNDYNYRPDQYGQIRGSLCINNNNYFGVQYGQFYCPIEGFEYEDTMVSLCLLI